MNNKEFADLLINRIEVHKKKTCDGKTGYFNAGYSQAHDHIIELISIQGQLSEFDKEPLYKWLPKKVDESHYHYYCENCNFRSKYFKSRYCPECGKQMEV